MGPHTEHDRRSTWALTLTYLSAGAHPPPLYSFIIKLGVYRVSFASRDVAPLPRHKSERFFYGNVPHSIISLVSPLPGKALATYLALWDRTKLDGTGKPITPPNAFALDPWGVDRHAKGRALRALEEAELISVTRSTGRAPRITLRDPRPRPVTPGQATAAMGATPPACIQGRRAATRR